MKSHHTEHDSLVELSRQRAKRLVEIDGEARRSRLSPDALAELRETCRTSLDFMEACCRIYADRPAFGSRRIDSTPLKSFGQGEASAFKTISYRELWERIVALAGGLARTKSAREGERVGICGFASPDYVIAEFACQYLGATSIPLQTTMTPEELRAIIDETEMTCLACSVEQLELLVHVVGPSRSLRSIVVIDERAEDDELISRVDDFEARIRALRPDILFFNIEHLEDVGRAAGTVSRADFSRAGDRLVSLVYTSGSTGTPKGAMFPESLNVEYWRYVAIDSPLEIPGITLNFMPLNHMAGRILVLRSMTHGGVLYFTAKSDMSTLFEDIRLVRPTFLMLVPRVSNLIFQTYQTTLLRRGIAKLEGADRERLEDEVMATMRHSFLGDRLLTMSTGTAPTAHEVLSFLERCFRVPVLSSYGSTEAGGITTDDRIQTDLVTDYRLVAVPELGYSLEDKPYPRGELHVKTKLATPGYFKNPEASAQLFDDDHYLNTGDIVEERAKGHVVWIDRRKNILKLAQGEFVSLWQIESIYSGGSPYIRQVYLYGNSLRAYLLAVVVPNAEALSADFGLDAENREEATKDIIRGELQRIARDKGLKPYEIPRDFLIEPMPFTRENGLLTESNKLAHRKLKAKYGEELERMFEEIESTQLEEMTRLMSLEGISVDEKVTKVVAAVLGVAESAVTSGATFRDLGGDSLSALVLSTRLEEVCAASVPVGLILNPATSIARISRQIEMASAGLRTSHFPTYTEIHGQGSEWVKADDLKIDRFLSPDEQMTARELGAMPLPSMAKAVLLTGANGFLGRFLLLELLAQLEHKNGKVYCLVRGSSDEAALARLMTSFTTDEHDLRRRLEQSIANGHLEVLAGDLTEAAFGLDREVYQRWAREVDCVLHNGALVNHAFSYPQLFEPNVIGTVQVIRFALSERLKAVSFVSSVGVVGGLERQGLVLETEDPRTMWQQRPVDSGYAVGYATSKWASEVLLRDAHERYGLPVSAYRCGMILAHRELVGQINVSDFFTRLLCGVIYTGVAPGSFYRAAQRRGAHFDGLPVDFIARAIVAIATDLRRDYATFHVVNPNWDDGVSLDLIIDWVADAGQRIEKIRDYAEWYRVFSERLRALDEPRQRHSPLPIIYQWQEPIDVAKEVILDATAFRARVTEIGDRQGGDRDIPSLDESFIQKCVADLEYLDLIEKPDLQAVASRRGGEGECETSSPGARGMRSSKTAPSPDSL